MLAHQCMGVAVHRQGNGRMPGQGLRYLGMHATTGQIADEGVPQTMEVRYQVPRHLGRGCRWRASSKVPDISFQKSGEENGKGKNKETPLLPLFPRIHLF